MDGLSCLGAGSQLCAWVGARGAGTRQVVTLKHRDVIYNLGVGKELEGPELHSIRTRICKSSRSLVQHQLCCCGVPVPIAACEAASA